MLKRILLFITIFMVVPLITKALNPACTSEEFNQLGNLADNTQISYEFDDQTETYKVIIYNLSSSTIIVNLNQIITFVSYDNGPIEQTGLTPGVTYLFPFYGSSESLCVNEYLLTKRVYLPAYNKYYKDTLCKGYENYELCKKFTPIKIESQEQFEQQLAQYKESIKNQPQEKPTVEEPAKKNLFDQAISFFLTYNLYFLIPIIVLGTAGIVAVKIRRRRSIL